MVIFGRYISRRTPPTASLIAMIAYVKGRNGVFCETISGEKMMTIAFPALQNVATVV